MRKIFTIAIIGVIGLAPLISSAQEVLTSAAAAAAGAAVQAGIAALSTASKIGVPITNPAIEQAQQIIAGAQTSETKQSFFKHFEEFIRTKLVKTLLDQLVDQTVSYIQGGGDPKFVTDWEGLVVDTAQQAAGDFAKEIGLGFLCEPFNLQVQLALQPVPRFAQRAQCTLDSIVGNIENFYNDFSQGGWIAYGESWKVQNNFFGSVIMAAQELEMRKEAAVMAKLNEAISGGGFLSIKDDNGNIITPGKALGDLTSKALGTDIDFVLNAQQLGDYVSAIANSLINRITKEGIAGLQGLSSRSERNSAAAQNQSIVENNFTFVKADLLSQINQTVSPEQQTLSTINGMIASLSGYKTSLNSLLVQFNAVNKTICQPSLTLVLSNIQAVVVADAKAAITAEIEQADSNIDQLLQYKSATESIITDLQNAKSQIEPLVNNTGDFIKLTNISNQISNILNPTTAVNFKLAMEDQKTAIDQNITQKLATFNQQLQQCQLNP